MPRPTFTALAFVLAAALMWFAPAEAQALTPAGMAEELIGAPVFSSEGQEVGVVSDVATDEDGQIGAVAMRTARLLGFGEREVIVPAGAFTALRGAVVLGFPADAVEGLLPGSSEQP